MNCHSISKVMEYIAYLFWFSFTKLNILWHFLLDWNFLADFLLLSLTFHRCMRFSFTMVSMVISVISFDNLLCILVNSNELLFTMWMFADLDLFAVFFLKPGDLEELLCHCLTRLFNFNPAEVLSDSFDLLSALWMGKMVAMVAMMVKSMTSSSSKANKE